MTVMNLSDAIIIYLSCGAPFAVHVLVTRRSGNSLITAVTTLYSFAAWPICAGRILYRFLETNITTPFENVSSGSALNAGNLLLELKSLSNGERSTSSYFEFKEAFERYIGLAEASMENGHHTEVAEIFNVSDHPAPAIATACLSRSTRQRLSMHLNRARSEFLSQVSEIATVSRDPSKIGSIAIALAEAVNDEEAANELRRRFIPESAPGSRSAPAEKDHLWSTEQTSPIVS